MIKNIKTYWVGIIILVALIITLPVSRDRIIINMLFLMPRGTPYGEDIEKYLVNRKTAVDVAIKQYDFMEYEKYLTCQYIIKNHPNVSYVKDSVKQELEIPTISESKRAGLKILMWDLTGDPEYLLWCYRKVSGAIPNPLMNKMEMHLRSIVLLRLREMDIWLKLNNEIRDPLPISEEELKIRIDKYLQESRTNTNAVPD